MSQNIKSPLLVSLTALSMFGCVEGNMLQDADNELSLINGDFSSDARLSVGKFRLMGSKGANYDAIVAARIQVSGIDARTVDGEYFRYAADFELDLIALQEGAGSVLARIKLPAGEYDQVRLHTAAAGEVVLADGSVFPLRIPSGEQSGLKIFFSPSLVIGADQLTIGVVEFDITKSFVFTSNTEVQFKPVLKVGVTQPLEIVSPGSNTDIPADDTEDGGDTTIPADDTQLPDDSSDDVFMPWIGV